MGRFMSPLSAATGIHRLAQVIYVHDPKWLGGPDYVLEMVEPMVMVLSC